jgi:hypothetical protein
MATALVTGCVVCPPLACASAGTAHGAGAVRAEPAAWRTVFSDHFTGPAGSPAGSKWTYDTGTRYHGPSCPVAWGTGEVESATSSAANVRQDGRGHLLIAPVKKNGGWTTGRIESVSARFAAPAGGEMKVTASIRQPAPVGGLGYWPAFWMLGAGFRASGAGTSGTMNCAKWPRIGEIDIMEDANALSEHSGTLHCGTAPGGPCQEYTGRTSRLRPCHDCQSRYHTYSVIVNRIHADRQSITWYLDGTAYFTVTESQVGTAAWKAAVDHGFFLMLDVAMGGSFPNVACRCTTPTPSTSSGAAMRIQYVSVSVR